MVRALFPPLALLAFVVSAAATSCGNPPLSLVTSSIPSAKVGSSYDVSLTAQGGQPPYIGSVGHSSLPQGFSISSSGDLTGMPAAVGTHTFNVVLSNSLKNNVAGVLTLTATATPTPNPSIVIVVTPVSVSVTAGTTEQFAASITGTSNAAVTWSVSGSGCSGTACGKISSSGLYTAPAAVPSSAKATVTATSTSDPTKSASAAITIVPLVGTTYYLAPAAAGGSDSNNGLSITAPWLSPNHPVKCGDEIIASASNAYSASNFASGEWGTVTCAAGNNVAWLKCVSFDACQINVTSGTLDGMRVSASYWGVQGWEVSNTAGGTAGGNCFVVVPPTSTANIHHIIFANDIADVCPLDGFSSINDGNAGVDYFVVVGNIAYEAGETNTYCGSGISVYEPVATDTRPGTHIYVAGNLSYSTTNPSGCNDGNGIIFDTFDGSQTPLPQTYVQQGVIDNNLSLSNGGVGISVEYNNAGTGTGHTTIFARRNTTWNNSDGAYQYGNPTCGEVQLYETATTQAFLNLAATNQVGCYGDSSNPLYAYAVSYADGTSSAYDNVGWSTSGSYGQILDSDGFTFGTTNLFGTNPGFANAVTPGAPSCGTATSVPNCTATIIADFAAANVPGYGYQVPSSTPVYDPLFPQWLCNVNLPAGLVTVGCLAQ